MVYADWLEENGSPDYAEFIRDQVENRESTRDWDLLNDHWEDWFPGCKRYYGGFNRDRRTNAGIAVSLTGGGRAVFTDGFVAEMVFPTLEKYMRAVELRLWERQPVTSVKILDREPYMHYQTSIWRWYDARFLSAAGLAYELPIELWGAFHDMNKRSLVRRDKSWSFDTRDAALVGLSLGAVALGRHAVGLPMLSEVPA